MIKTNRLILKPLDDSDQDSMIDMFTNEQIKQTYMLPDFPSKENAAKLFKRMQVITQNANTIDCGIYQQNTLIGFMNTVVIEDKKIEIGYVIHPQFQNQGYATVAFQAIIKNAFDIGYNVVVSGAFEENTASRRVMEKCGMRLSAEEEDIKYRGKTHHCVYYSIAKS